ncbi:MAG: FtsX-like permease family protein [Alphaproteobacteria bacterium]|nr:FtsX-like permease family protein [Alphaproteobacteria bacterium]
MPSLLFFMQKDRKLGIAERKGRYDLPLHTGASTNFMLLLIALMSFLATLALAGNMAIGNIAQRWTSGLENQITIEIPATDAKNKIRSAETISALREKAIKALKDNPNVKTIDAMTKEQVEELISPWLGKTQGSLGDLPLPALISAKLSINTPEQIEKLNNDLHGISENINLDTHESWLDDILKLAGALKLSALLILLIIALTTATAIAAAILSRMAEHREDIELLHLMGASNTYIARQFQRHALTITIKGSLLGLIAGIITLLILGLLSGQNDQALMPHTNFSIAQLITFLILPALTGLIAFFTTRTTVLRTLAQMP